MLYIQKQKHIRNSRNVSYTHSMLVEHSVHFPQTARPAITGSAIITIISIITNLEVNLSNIISHKHSIKVSLLSKILKYT